MIPLAFCSLIFGCEPPPGNLPPYVPNLKLGLASLSLDPSLQGAPVGDPCPTPGSNCMRRGEIWQTGSAGRSAFTKFESYYLNDNVAGYFLSTPISEYESLFPNLSNRSELIGKLTDNTYGIKVTEDTSFIIFDKAIINGRNNTVFGFVK